MLFSFNRCIWIREKKSYIFSPSFGNRCDLLNEKISFMKLIWRCIVYQLSLKKRLVNELFVYPWVPQCFSIFLLLIILTFIFNLLYLPKSVQKWYNMGFFGPTLLCDLGIGHFQIAFSTEIWVIQFGFLSNVTLFVIRNQNKSYSSWYYLNYFHFYWNY